MTAATNTSARLRGAAALTSMVEFNELHVRSIFCFRGRAARRDVGQFRFSLTLNMSYHVAILAVLNFVRGTFLNRPN